jgi:hypothetical protein
MHPTNKGFVRLAYLMLAAALSAFIIACTPTGLDNGTSPSASASTSNSPTATATPTPNQLMTGLWNLTVTWSNNYVSSGTWTLASDGTFTGQDDVTSDYTGTWSVSGNTFTLTYDVYNTVYTGTLSSDYRSISGNAQSPNVAGTFVASKAE